MDKEDGIPASQLEESILDFREWIEQHKHGIINFNTEGL